MHESVFESGWGSDALIQQHRAVVAPDHRGRGREVISLDWTFSHHDRGPDIYAAEKSYDYVENRGVYSSRYKAYKAIKKMMSEPKSYLIESPEKERKFYKIETWILDD